MRFVKSALKLTRRTLAISFTLLTAVAVAQNPPADVCATIVRAALQAANQSCSGTSRNQVCYGNVLGQAIPADGVTDLTFENVGDIATLTQIKALQLSPLNPTEEEWGVALMQLQANLPDTLPGQNVTFLLFGDVTVEENIGEQARVEATVNTPANLRLGPVATSPVVGSVGAGAAVTATGKTVNQLGQTWVRIRYEEYRTSTGWILSELVDADFATLPDVPADSLTLNPMQAFYFKTGIGQTQCAEAPTSGVVVQTPEGAGKVNFSVNGIDIALGSTAFLSSPDGINNTCISLLTGDADLASAGRIVDLNPGERSCTPLNDDGTSGPPGQPEPFDPQEIASIGDVIESLPDEIEVPDPAPTRAPTLPPTQVPTATPTAEPPVFVPPPAATDVPATGVPATDVPLPTVTSTSTLTLTPTPTPTEEIIGRFVNVSSTRNGATVELTASGGPDAPSSYAWFDGEVTGSGPIVTFGYWPDAQITVQLDVCWADGECINQGVNVIVPPCPIDFTLPTTITLRYEGGGEYVVQKANEDCQFGDIGNIGQSNPTFNSSAHAGEWWRVVIPADTSIYVWDHLFDLYAPSPIDQYIYDPFITPEARFIEEWPVAGTATPAAPPLR